MPPTPGPVTVHPHGGPSLLIPAGDWATWVQSAATVGALVAAIVAAMVAQRVYKIESERDERAAAERRARAETERRAQADKAAAWFAWVPQGQSSDIPTRFRTPFGWAAFIRNASDLPIYDVDIDYYYVEPGASPASIPGPRGSAAGKTPVLPPQDEIYVFADSKVLDLVDPDQRKNHAVAVEFRDATGVRWRRDIYGKLAELTPTTP